MSRRWIFYWIIVVASVVNYVAMVAWSLPKLQEMAGGQIPFDLRPFGYSFEEAIEFLSALGTQGREFYANTQHILDSTYPALLAVTLIVGILALIPGNLGRILAGFALLGSVFDYLENWAVSALLLDDPSKLSASDVNMASQWTVLKSIFGAIAITALLVVVLVRVIARVRAMKNA